MVLRFPHLIMGREEGFYSTVTVLARLRGRSGAREILNISLAGFFLGIPLILLIYRLAAPLPILPTTNPQSFRLRIHPKEL